MGEIILIWLKASRDSSACGVEVALASMPGLQSTKKGNEVEVTSQLKFPKWWMIKKIQKVQLWPFISYNWLKVGLYIL